LDRSDPLDREKCSGTEKVGKKGKEKTKAWIWFRAKRTRGKESCTTAAWEKTIRPRTWNVEKKERPQKLNCEPEKSLLGKRGEVKNTRNQFRMKKNRDKPGEGKQKGHETVQQFAAP